jgi:hypothetical protein
MEEKILCILANSVKNSKSCIAGIEIIKTTTGRWQNTGRWIRPISHRPKGAISNTESLLQNIKRNPKLFDIVKVPLHAPANVEGQPEDWLIEPSFAWQHLGYFESQNSASAFLEMPKDLWLQQGEKQDRVSPEWVAQYQMPSLYLIAPEELKIYVQESDYGTGSRRSRRAAFRYRELDYDFGMTDPVTSNTHFPDFRTRKPGSHAGLNLDCVAICVSLAPAWKGDLASQSYHFKLVAGIVEKK